MRRNILGIFIVIGATSVSCKARKDSTSKAASTNEDSVCELPKGVPVLSVAIDPAVLPKDDSASPSENASFAAKAGRGLILINQINNDLCRDHDNQYVSQLRVALMTNTLNPNMHAVISPNPEPNFGKDILKLFSGKNQPPCRDGSAWVNMTKLAKDTSNDTGAMSRFMADIYQFSFLFIGKPETFAGKPECAAGISNEEMEAKQNYFEIAARNYLNSAE